MRRCIQLKTWGLSGLLAVLAACGGGSDNPAPSPPPPPPPPPVPAAALTISPASATVTAGGSTTTTATVTRSGGFADAVTIAGTGAPAGVTVTGGVIAAGAATQSVTIATETTAAAGAVTVTVTASGTGVTISPASFVLTINAAPPAVDSDGDGLPDATDPDDDNDSVPDVTDAFPLNPARSTAIQPAFPKVAGIYQLPDYPSTDQLAWVLAQLAATQTTLADINAHFTPQALTATSAAQWQSLFQTMRTRAPNALVVDLVAATPVSVTALIGTPGSNATGIYFSLTTTYGTGLINSLSANNFALNGSLQYAADSSLTLAQAADKFQTLAPQNSLLVAEIVDNQCVAIEQRSGTTARGTGSIFKHWVLGALGQAIEEGDIDPSTAVPLVAAERVMAGTVLGAEPTGASIPLRDMATMMMGNSDNTSTDHLHELVGRTRVEAMLTQFHHASPELMTPFLSVNEQFHLLIGVPLVEAQGYVDGTEAHQRNYLETMLAPRGPWTGTGPSNLSLWLPVSWRASPMDVCNAFAGLRQFNDQSAAFQLVDRALSSQAAQPFVRDEWERVWYKGGSLESGAGYVVLTHSWMIESDARGAFVVVAMANNPAVGVDQFQVQSVTSRVLQLVDQAN